MKMAELDAGMMDYFKRAEGISKDWPKAKNREEAREAKERLENAIQRPVPDSIAVNNRFIDAPGRQIPIRTYRPRDRDRPPAVLYFHGGWFVGGSVFTHDVYCAGIVEKTGTQVISVNYRLAPENPHPAAVEDCFFALCWAVEHADMLDIDASRLAVGGDSAGGALTAACSLMARDKRGPELKLQFQICPTLDTDFNTVSYLSHKDPSQSAASAKQNWQAYLQGRLETTDAYAVPMRAADLSNLPPAYILTAEHDPLRDDGERYGKRLAEAGVPTTLRRAPGTVHGFLRARFMSKVAEEEFESLGVAIREALDTA